MGASHAKLVYARWGDLPATPFRLLVYMALTAKDNEGEPRFWGGRESMALALGRELPDDDPAARRSAIRAVDRAIRSLTVAGALTVVTPSAPGRHAVYRLELSMERTTLTAHRTDHGERGPNRSQRTTVSGHNGPRFADQRTTVSGPTDHGERGPEEEEDIRGVSQEPNGDLRTVVTVSRARGRDEPIPDTESRTGPPALRVITGRRDTSPRVVTQPGLWPSAVPDPEPTVNRDEALADIRQTLKGKRRAHIRPYSVRPSTVAAPPTPAPKKAAPPSTGNGFCLPCYNAGRIVVASDPATGSTCDTHTREKVS